MLILPTGNVSMPYCYVASNDTHVAAVPVADLSSLMGLYGTHRTCNTALKACSSESARRPYGQESMAVM